MLLCETTTDFVGYAECAKQRQGRPRGHRKGDDRSAAIGPAVGRAARGPTAGGSAAGRSTTVGAASGVEEVRLNQDVADELVSFGEEEVEFHVIAVGQTQLLREIV